MVYNNKNISFKKFICDSLLKNNENKNIYCFIYLYYLDKKNMNTYCFECAYYKLNINNTLLIENAYSAHLLVNLYNYISIYCDECNKILFEIYKKKSCPYCISNNFFKKINY